MFELGRKLRILMVCANDGGCSFYRQISPMKVLAENFSDQVEIRRNDNPLQLDEKTGQTPPIEQLEDMNWADIIFSANILKYGGAYTLRVCGVAKQLGKFYHFDTDDLLTDLYPEHHLYSVYKEQKLDEITKHIYGSSDLISVTQPKFAEKIKQYVGRLLAVFENTIDYSLPCWNAQRVETKFMRVGWLSGMHHRSDVKVFESVPHLVNQKVGRENIKWDFYGCPPPDPNKKTKSWEDAVWPEYKQKLFMGFKGQPNYQIYYALPPDQYGFYVSNMDVSIAPLKPNQFNDSKSVIKCAEVSRYKIPLVASNVGSYNTVIENGKTGYLIDPDAPKTEWVRILTKLAKDKKHRLELGYNLHEATKDRFDAVKMAENRLKVYKEAFQILNYNPK